MCANKKHLKNNCKGILKRSAQLFLCHWRGDLCWFIWMVHLLNVPGNSTYWKKLALSLFCYRKITTTKTNKTTAQLMSSRLLSSCLFCLSISSLNGLHSSLDCLFVIPKLTVMRFLHFCTTLGATQASYCFSASIFPIFRPSVKILIHQSSLSCLTLSDGEILEETHFYFNFIFQNQLKRGKFIFKKIRSHGVPNHWRIFASMVIFGSN